MKNLSRQEIMIKEKNGELVKVFSNAGKFLGWRKPLYNFPAPPGYKNKPTTIDPKCYNMPSVSLKEG